MYQKIIKLKVKDGFVVSNPKMNWDLPDSMYKYIIVIVTEQQNELNRLGTKHKLIKFVKKKIYILKRKPLNSLRVGSIFQHFDLPYLIAPTY